jgi:hypothetical protein
MKERKKAMLVFVQLINFEINVFLGIPRKKQTKTGIFKCFAKILEM